MSNGKGKIAYYVAWLSFGAALISAIIRFMADTKIPNKDEFEGKNIKDA